MAKSKNISTSQLALMTAAAVISLRGLPMILETPNGLPGYEAEIALLREHDKAANANKL